MRGGSTALLAAALVAAAGCPTRSPPVIEELPDARPTTPHKSIVILMVGDGMGKGQLEAASYYASGKPADLSIQKLPVHGELLTSSPSGVTDSAAAATALSCGDVTYNGRIALDRLGNELPLLFTRARELGLATGIVVTSYIPHATPAAFTAHNSSRNNLIAIADEQALVTRPEVMLGGGARYFLPSGDDSSRDDDGLLIPLDEAGYQIVTTTGELDQASPDLGDRLFGIFANGHMSYVADLEEETSEPELRQMTLKALEFLDRDPEGFVLMVEGSHIDRASHGNDLARTVTETIAFDQAVAAVVDWAAGREEVTLLVTADHETGGLEVLGGSSPGEYPPVSWQTGGHTNARVDIYGLGPATEELDGTIRDNRWVAAVAAARIAGSPVVAPPRLAIPNGDLHDLRHLAATQTLTSGFGVGFNQLDGLYLDADQYGLTIGIAGLFQRDTNAVVILVDGDFGSSSGPARLIKAFDDVDGAIDSILSNLRIDASAITGFGVDLAVVDFGAIEANRDQFKDRAGLRGLHPPYGETDDLTWYDLPIIFGDGARPALDPLEAQPAVGLEVLIPWSDIYPGLDGSVPAGAKVAIAAVLVGSDGKETSNQALPPFPPGTDNQSGNVTLPGVVVFAVDADGDWIADGDSIPTIVTP